MYDSILEALDKWAHQQPDKKVWTFLGDNEEVVDSFTYKELQAAVCGLAHHLLESGNFTEGDRVLLVFFPGLHFMVSLLACFVAGLVAVPVFPPDPSKLKKDLHHFISIQSNSGATVVLSHSLYNFAKKVSAIGNMFSGSGVAWPDLKWVVVDDVIKKTKTSFVAVPEPEKHEDRRLQVAFLQYTSGSTSEPKGVMITHHNLAHNETLIKRELKSNTDTVNVSWLPQYHDMGLIGSYLGLLYCGGTGYYLSPISFLKDPLVWLRTISKYRGTHTQAPNFAFALSTRKFKELGGADGGHITRVMGENFDLSSLQHMINAAEPIDHTTILQFIDTFGKYGLTDPKVIVPTYGLAEHTVFACSGGLNKVWVSKASLEKGEVNVLATGPLSQTTTPPEVEAEAAGTMCIVGCGFPTHGEGVHLLIVNPDTNEEARPGEVGEIWINSPSKADGYWGNTEVTARDFHAHLVLNIAHESTGFGGLASSSSKSNRERSNSSGSTGKNKVASSPVAAAAAAVVGVVSGSNPLKSNDGSGKNYMDSDGFLRTGDLGFLHNDELYICGRQKDLIIVRGSNHYPQDIERTGEFAIRHIGRPGCSAAFGLKKPNQPDTEVVIYVAELRDDHHAPDVLRAAVDSIKRSVASTHGVALSTICLLKPRSIPKTTSGKIARSWCRRGFEANTLVVVHRYDNAQADDLNAAAVAAAAPAGSSSGADADSLGIELSNASPAAGGGAPAESGHGGGSMHSRMTPEEIAALPTAALIKQLQDLLTSVAGSSPAGEVLQGAASGAKGGIVNTPLPALGLDSMTIVQFKGILEKKYGMSAPDEFMFTRMASLSSIALIIQRGGLTDQQKDWLENGIPEGELGEDSNGRTTEISTPLCPWCTCCY